MQNRCSGHTRPTDGCSRPQCSTASGSLLSGSPGSGPCSCLIRGPLSQASRGTPGCAICACGSSFLLHPAVTWKSSAKAKGQCDCSVYKLARQPKVQTCTLKRLPCRSQAQLDTDTALIAGTGKMSALRLQHNATTGNYAGATSLYMQ